MSDEAISQPSIQRFSSASPYESVIGYSRVVRAGGWYITAGCTGRLDAEGRVIPDAYGQTVASLRFALQELARAGCPREAVVQTRLYVSHGRDCDDVGRAHHDLLGDVRPAATMLVIAGFLDPAMLVEVELTGWQD